MPKYVGEINMRFDKDNVPEKRSYQRAYVRCHEKKDLDSFTRYYPKTQQLSYGITCIDCLDKMKNHRIRKLKG